MERDSEDEDGIEDELPFCSAVGMSVCVCVCARASFQLPLSASYTSLFMCRVF